jgi:hypothetical protein
MVHVLKSAGSGFIDFIVSYNNNQWIPQSVYQQAMGWMAGVQFPAEVRAFSLFHSAETGYGAHPASYPMGTRGFFPQGVKKLGHEAHHSLPSTAKVKNGATILLLHRTS